MTSSKTASVAQPMYSVVYDFERNFDLSTREWMDRNQHISYYCMATYLLLIFAGKYWMRSRSKFELRITTTVWNIVLTGFSFATFSRMLPELIYLLQKHGFTESVCNPSVATGEVTAFWYWIFLMSKMVELGDTAFVVLRKHPLIFLHWYHHVIVLSYGWSLYIESAAPARWFIILNSFAHSMMYSYYALRTIGIRLPRFVSVIITACQISQMVIGSFVCMFASYVKRSGRFCQWSVNVEIRGLAVYVSILILFVHFFYTSYMAPKKKDKKKQ